VSERIEIIPEVCSGRPVVRGTRIPVHTVLGFLAAGDSIEEVLKGYPRLTLDDVLACLQFASKVTDNGLHSLPLESAR
jgi:uncharacterized protein (DUF433 family)